MVTKSNIPIFITIPNNVLHPVRKVTIDDVIVTDDIINITVEPGVTTDTSSCTLLLDNRNGKHTGEYSLNDIVKVYIDYNGATTKIFEGHLFVPIYTLSMSGYQMEIQSYGYGYDAIKKKVNYDPANQYTVKQLWEYLITTYLNTLYGHSLDFSNIVAMNTPYSPSWSRKSIWDCFQELITVMGGGYDFYCDMDKVWHVFVKGSRTSNDAVVYGDNLIDCRIIDGDLTALSNKVSVYGETIDGVARYRMFNSTASQTTYGVFESDVEDSDLTTETAINAKGASELSIKTSLEQKGNLRAVGIPNILPGYNIYIMNPYCNVMGLKRVVDVTHNYSASGFYTTIQFEEKEKGTVYLMQQQLKNKSSRSMYGMNNSYIAQFFTTNYGENTQTPDANAELETMFQTVVWEDRLMLELNTETGYAITKTITIPDYMTQYVIVIKGSNLEGDDGNQWIRVDIKIGNANWKTVSKETIYDNILLSKNIKLKFTMISLTSKIKSIALLWK